MGDDRAQLSLGGRLQTLRAVDGLVPVLLLLVDVDELAQGLYAMDGVLGQGLKDVLGAIEEPCAQVVLTELEKRLAPLLGTERPALDQVVVDTDRAVDFTPPPVQVAEREVSVDCLAVDLEHPDEELDRLVRLLVQQIVDSPEVMVAQLGLSGCALATHRRVPAGRGRDRQQEPEPIQGHQIHHSCSSASAHLESEAWRGVTRRAERIRGSR